MSKVQFYILVYLLTTTFHAYSQGVIIKTGGIMRVIGSTNILINNGNFENNGTYTNGTETLIMSGTNASTLSGTSETNIFKLNINNTGGITTLFDQLTSDSLKIESGSKFTINPNKAITINSTITNNAGTGGIIIKASPTLPNGTLIFNNVQESPVNATVEMYSIANWDLNATSGSKYRWQFFGVPVKTITASPTFNGSYIRKYNESGIGSGYSSTNRWIQLVNGNSLTELNGYEIVQQAAKTYSIKGELINADISKSLSYTSGAEYSGQHIFGNPFTAAIDIKDISFGAQTEGSIYQYNTGSYNDWSNTTAGPSDTLPGQYTVSTKLTAGDLGIPRYIASMQGFLVKAMSNSENATLNIPYSSVRKNTTLQRVKKTENSYIIINVKGEKFADRMWLYSNPDCSRTFDNGWDGRKFYGSTACPQIYGSESDDNYQIDVVDNINNTMIGFIAGIDSIYTISFTHKNISDQYPSLFLEDLQTNIITDICTDGSSYSFKATNTTYSQDRFKIITTSGLSTLNSNTDNKSFIAYYSHQQLNIYNPFMQGGSFKIFDLSGRLLEQDNLKPIMGMHSYPTKLNNGVYVCQINSGQKNIKISFIVK